MSLGRGKKLSIIKTQTTRQDNTTHDLRSYVARVIPGKEAEQILPGEKRVCILIKRN